MSTANYAERTQVVLMPTKVGAQIAQWLLFVGEPVPRIGETVEVAMGKFKITDVIHDRPQQRIVLFGEKRA